MRTLAITAPEELRQADHNTRKEVMPNQPARPPDDNATPPATGAVAFTASERGKAGYAAASEMERARIRAARLPKDGRLRAWVIERGVDCASISYEDAAAIWFVSIRYFVRLHPQQVLRM